MSLRSPNPTLGAMVRCLAPQLAAVDAERRRVVLEDVVVVLQAQRERLPQPLRLLYAGGVVAFDALAVCRYGQRFRSLSETSQANYLAAWRDSRLPLVRDFILLVAGTTLLSFFDHALVRASLDGEEDRDAARA